MPGREDAIDVSSLKRAVHGEPVGGKQEFICDYCDAPISIDEPVCYEAIRVADFPNLKKLLDVPAGWHLDAARCHDCDLDVIEPATDGYDEVVIMVDIVEAEGFPCVDASDLAIVDVAPTETGYYPAALSDRDLHDATDFGICRWIRRLGILEHPSATAEARESMWVSIGRSKEIPPQMAGTRPDSDTEETQSS